MKQLSVEEAKNFAEQGHWQEMTPKARGVFQLHQELLCMPFNKFHEGLEIALGRSVFTHELADREALKDELKEKRDAPSIQEILDMIPEEKRIILEF